MRAVRYRVDSDCETCARILAWRRTQRRGMVFRPDMIVVDVQDPKALARHPHLWVRQCGGQFNPVVAAAMEIAGVPERVWWEAA